MNRQKFAVRSLFVLTLALLPSLAWADLFSELKRFAPENYAKRVGLEVEMDGLPLKKTASLIQETAGGGISNDIATYDYIDPINGLPAQLVEFRLKVSRSRLGKVLLKPEDNAQTLADLTEQASTSSVLEIVTDPLHYKKVGIFQNSLDRIRTEGGRGTSPKLAVALQVNVEMGEGRRENIQTAKVISILSNYLSPANRAEIAARLKVPEVRRGYLGLPPPGFYSRLLSPDYRPDWDQLYMDSMYRSSLEQLGDAEAWTVSDEQARLRLQALVEDQGFEILLPVVKWNYLRYSSLMMFMRPEEWLSKKLMESHWFHDYPVLEFREPNNDFEAQQTVDWVLSFVAASEIVGRFDARSLACEGSLGSASRRAAGK